jgi:hypothetical protein
MTTVRRLAFVCALLAPLQTSACAQKISTAPASETKTVAATDRAQVSILGKVPEKVDTKALYLFYLHGKIIEEKGRRPTDARYGVYEYEQILDALGREGFIVISEARAKGTEPKEYAQKVAGQIQALLQKNVPPGNITVVGASKGAVITMLVSTVLKHRDVNFVLMSNCNDWVLENFDVNLHGNVLSIYDYKDEFGQSCGKIFGRASGLNRSKEIVLRLGTGHAVLYKPMREWIDPAAGWAKGTLQ